LTVSIPNPGSNSLNIAFTLSDPDDPSRRLVRALGGQTAGTAMARPDRGHALPRPHETSIVSRHAV